MVEKENSVNEKVVKDWQKTCLDSIKEVGKRLSNSLLTNPSSQNSLEDMQYRKAVCTGVAEDARAVKKTPER